MIGRRAFSKMDLHIHSTVSDGKNSPMEIVLYALKENINILSITDHDTFLGSMLAMKYSHSSDVLVLLGAEFSFPEGDVLVYCVDEPTIGGYSSLAEFIDAVREENCIIVPAHPFDSRRNSIGEKIYEYKWDAIEGFNGASCMSDNELALRVAKELGLPVLGNSDAHVVDEIGRVYMLTEPADNVEDVIDSILRGRVRIRVSGKYREKNCSPVPGVNGKFSSILSEY